MTTDKPQVIALTGGIAAGKTTVASLFASWGAAVVDADQLARAVVAPGSEGLERVVAYFGPEYLLPDGSLHREKLGKRIFSSPDEKKALENILHPLIRERWLAALAALKASGNYSLIIYSVPLFFESGKAFPEIERVVLVVSQAADRIARIVSRDSLSSEEAQRRISSQMPDEEKIPRSDFVIRNDSSVEDLTAQTKRVFERLQQASLAPR